MHCGPTCLRIIAKLLLSQNGRFLILKLQQQHILKDFLRFIIKTDSKYVQLPPWNGYVIFLI